jgi:hypothetical protein
MAVLSIPLLRGDWTLSQAGTTTPAAAWHFICDTDAELPASVANGCSAVSLQSGYKSRVGGQWVSPGAAPAGSRLPQSIGFGGYVVVTNVGAAYDAVAPSQGLGLVAVDFTGVTSLFFLVRVNKVGTGTQSWQLWNETDAAEIAVLTDAGATGAKLLQTTVAAGLPSGVKLLRVRAKSTTATDDPIYFGATVVLS